MFYFRKARAHGNVPRQQTHHCVRSLRADQELAADLRDGQGHQGLTQTHIYVILYYSHTLATGIYSFFLTPAIIYLFNPINGVNCSE